MTKQTLCRVFSMMPIIAFRNKCIHADLLVFFLLRLEVIESSNVHNKIISKLD